MRIKLQSSQMKVKRLLKKCKTHKTQALIKPLLMTSGWHFVVCISIAKMICPYIVNIGYEWIRKAKMMINTSIFLLLSSDIPLDNINFVSQRLQMFCICYIYKLLRKWKSKNVHKVEQETIQSHWYTDVKHMTAE